MVTSSSGLTGSTYSGGIGPQEPHERSRLLDSNTRNDVLQFPTYPRHSQSAQNESRLADEEARIGASDSSKADAIPKPIAGIAGVISVLLLGMCLIEALLYDFALLFFTKARSLYKCLLLQGSS